MLGTKGGLDAASKLGDGLESSCPGSVYDFNAVGLETHGGRLKELSADRQTEKTGLSCDDVDKWGDAEDIKKI